MVRATTRGGETVDFLTLSAGFGREGVGALSESGGSATYSWTTPAGLAAVATGAADTLSVGLDDVPSGRAETLEVEVSAQATFVVEADRAWIGLRPLAGGEPPGGALDRLLRGEDRFLAAGAGDARLFGDGMAAEDGDRGRDDLFDLKGTGDRQAAGDFWLIPSTRFEVRAGDDDMRIVSDGAVAVWGDVFAAMDKTNYDGALIRGGDDRLDASRALDGVRGPETPVLVGDVGTVGVGWLLRAGDDELIGPRKAAAALVGDVLSGDPEARLYCGDDVLRGGRRGDTLYGDAQALLEEGVYIRPGKDLLRGGPGADTLYGDLREAAAGTVLLAPNAGADRIYGEGGRDRAHGGWGADRIYGGAGDDRLRGEAGGDTVEGGGASDRIWGGRGGDALSGDAGGDRLWGGRGADRLWGDNGGDRLWGQAGGDRLRGGDGSDAMWGGRGADRLWGDGGRDKLQGGAQRDWIHSGADADVLRGGGGADELHGGGGRDRLVGGAGDDLLDGGGGRDRLAGGPGADVFRLARGGGRDVVEDFDPRHDRLSVQRGLGEVEAQETARGVLVSAGGAELFLEDVRLEDFDPAAHDWL